MNRQTHNLLMEKRKLYKSNKKNKEILMENWNVLQTKR